MAGFVAGTPQTLLTGPATIAADAEISLLQINCETDANGNPVACGEIFIDAAAAASGDLEIYLVRVTETGGTAATNKYRSLSIDAGSSGEINIPLMVGVYNLWVKNNDTVNTATINSVILKTYTWA